MLVLKDQFQATITDLSENDLNIALDLSNDWFAFLSYSLEYTATLPAFAVAAVHIDRTYFGFEVHVFNAEKWDGELEDAYVSHKFNSLSEVFSYIQTIQATPFTDICWG